MLRQIKKYKYIIILFITIIISVSILNNFSIKTNKIYIKPKEYDFNLSAENILNRYTYYENKNCIYIGDNNKEISNGYYDIKIQKQNEKLYIYINKLFKKSENNKIYDEKYLEELITYINKLLDFKFDFTKLEFKIKDLYLKIKTNQQKELIKETIIIDNNQIEFSDFNNMLQIII